MFLKASEHRTRENLSLEGYLLTWIEAFLVDRKARGCAKGTLEFYYYKMKIFTDYCKKQCVNNIYQITPSLIRQYLIYLEDTGHNPGGRHAAYRALRAFLLWYEDEVDPDGWKNPINKVRAPRVPIEPLEPVSFEVVSKMVDACNRSSFTGYRDRAILLFLLDSGVRAGECLSLNVSDINIITGEVLIREGKGKKSRYVFVGKHSRQAIRKYLRIRKDNYPALWITEPKVDSGRFTYSGLRSMIKRIAKKAEVAPPSLHDFRRAFALAMLRNGTDIFTLAKLMGHKGVTVLQRYLRETRKDIESAHRQASPVENGLIKNE